MIVSIMKSLLLIFPLLVGLAGCGSGSSSSASSEPERVTFSGSGNMGIFDPSVTRDPGTGYLWMSYSSVDESPFYDPALYWAVSLRLAYSDDHGISWQDAGIVAPAYALAAVGPMDDISAETYGLWQSETSSLTYDPSAPASERWKLIWHQYLHAGSPGKENSHFNRHGWFALKMASTPTALAAATPVKLFGGAGLSTDGENTAAPAHSPIGGPPAIQLNLAQALGVQGNNLDQLRWCAFVEPNLFATDTYVYLTTACADAVNYDPINNPVAEEYIIHFRCASPCTMTDATGWEYMGRLLTPTDALTATGYHHFQAPALVERGGKTYLIVTPVEYPSTTPYSGCRVYQFTDIDSNQLLRSLGQLLEKARVDGEAGTHNGACAAYNGMDGGLLLSQFEPANTPETFRVYKSQVDFTTGRTGSR